MPVAGIDNDRLRSLVGQIEEREAAKLNAAEDIKDLYDIAKSQGFDTKIMRRIVKERRRKKSDVEQEELLLDLYRKALGEWKGTPLGEFSEAAE